MALAEAAEGGHPMRKLLLAAALLLAIGTSAQATQSYCAVVKPTPDGFVNLREGPGTRFPIIRHLRPYDSVLVDTGKCRAGICDQSGRWQFIESVPRIDGQSDEEKQHFTQGWIRERYIKQITCP